jgi:foldase protein PrsA
MNIEDKNNSKELSEEFFKSTESEGEDFKPAIPKKSVEVKSILTIVLGLVLLLLVAEGVLLYGFKKDDNQFVKAAATTLYFPMAMVEMSPIPMSMYWNELNLVLRACEEVGTDCQISDQDRQQVSDNLINEKVIIALAKKYNVTVDDTKLNEEYDKIVQQNGGEESFKSILTEKFGWSVDEFKHRVYISLLGQALEESKIEQVSARHILFTTTADMTEEQKNAVKTKAQGVLDRIKNGDSFEDLAKEFSEDPGSKETGGDLGFFARGVMTPDFETPAFALAKGQVSDLVQTSYGWHIIKVEDKKGEVKGSFNDWMEEQKKDMRIWVFFNVKPAETESKPAPIL